MALVQPLCAWRLSGPSLPERLIAEAPRAAFSLPGAQALAEYASLIEDAPEGAAEQPAAPAEAPDAPFVLPALLPEDMPGPACLTHELRMGGLCADCAALQIDLLLGRGEVWLDGERVALFRSGPFSLDLTRALLSDRAHTLCIRFDGTRPAGVCGGALLRAARLARLRRCVLLPNAGEKTVTLRAAVQGLRAGTYLLRVQPCPPSGGMPAESARELTLTLAEGETRTAELTFSLPGERFFPGRPYVPPAVKLTLWQMRPSLHPAPQKGFWHRKSAPAPAHPRPRPGALCDSAALMVGYPGQAPRAYLPLRAKECLMPPGELAERIRALGLPAVALPVPAPDLLALELTRSGIAALQKTPRDEQERERLARFPCLTMADTPDIERSLPPEASAWQLASMIGAPRRMDPGLTPADLLAEIAGRELDPSDGGTRAVLAWLRAVLIRLRAEAARQGRASGPLCLPGEWDNPDIAEALGTAFAPLHLSALPQRGAWWTLSRFSATLHAFLPEQGLPESVRLSAEPLLAEAVLEAEDGSLLARLCTPCPPAGGEIGVLEAALPASPCVLTLSTMLLSGKTILERSALPVYVGERGVLEAAFGG